MHRPTRTIALLLALVTALVLGAGCAAAAPPAAPPTPSPTPVPTKEPVAWMDGICGALLPLALLSGIPEVDPADPPAAARAISMILSTMMSTLDGVISGVKAQGPSPIKGGDEFTAKMVEGLTFFRSTAQGAKTKIDSTPVDNPQALGTALQEVGTTLVSMQNPLAAVVPSPEIEAASAQAPNCRSIGG